MKCDNCEHMKCEKGDRWTPNEYYCDLDMEEENCDEYKYFDALQYQIDEANRKHDAKLKDWREG